jgi:hypothetical protein
METVETIRFIEVTLDEDSKTRVTVVFCWTCGDSTRVESVPA